MTKGRRLDPAWLDAAVRLLGDSGRGGTLDVDGVSMLPNLLVGQQLAVDFDPDRLRRGDVVVFREGERLTVHRLIGRTSGPGGVACLRTRGDNVPRFDAPVPPDHVVGRVVAAGGPSGWTSLDGPLARMYALKVAAHCFIWTGVWALVGRLDRRLERAGSRFRLQPDVARVDRAGLWLAHRLFHRLCHRRIAAPEQVGTER